MSGMIEPVARIRIELQEVEPKVWRRVDVPLSSTLAVLHEIIQASFGWHDYHLHEFEIGERVYGEPHEDDQLFGHKVYRAAAIRLKTLLERGVERFLYRYDFGDGWEHEMTIEGVRDGEADIAYPAFVDGARRCPPEDSGGPHGFTNFLEAVLDPNHEEHEAMVEWHGGPFDPEDIDERQVRLLLGMIAARRRGPLASHRRGNRRGRRKG